MGLVLRCFVALFLCTFAAGSDFVQDPRPAGRARFERSSNIVGNVVNAVKRSLPEWLNPATQTHRIHRRSTDQDSCSTLQGYEAKLGDNTHRYTLKDLSGSVSLAWVGDGTGVILALTTFQVPFFMIRFGQSKLYRSEDYGKSFEDVTELINNTFIRSEYGIAISPDNSGRVILMADVSETSKYRMFVSDDFGKTFSQHDLPFIPLMQPLYNPEDCKVLVVLSNSYELWLSKDFGSSWNKIYNMACLVKWGDKSTLFFTTNSNGSCSERGELDLMRTTNYGEKMINITKSKKIYSFGLGGRFLFASVMTGKGTTRMIHVSVDHGDTWNMAQLPLVDHTQFYSILAANNDMVFMHVDDLGDTGVGTIYVSDDRGTVYSKSLERHLYTTTGGDTDFTNVTSLRGVFLTSILAADNITSQSVVSFDRGGEWVPLQKPANTICDASSRDPEKCSLRLHAAYSIAQRLNVPLAPLSEPNAVGLIISHGSVGDSMSAMRPDVFVSDDGGYTWLKVLDGPHHYAILDSGGLLVAVEHNPNEPINTIKFSTDEGQCWHEYNFTTEPIYFTGLASEPGARSMNVSLWGYQDTILAQYWVSFTIDFRELLTRDCEDSDYVQWLAHSDDISDPKDGCMLGYKEKFLRLRKDSVCWNGRDYEINKQHSPCQCTLDDFLCDFGYYRQENSSLCVEEPDMVGKVLEFCLYGREEQLLTNGYRKIPGDKCEGGMIPERKEVDLRHHCVSDLLDPSSNMQVSSKAMPAVITFIVIIMLLSVVAGVLFIKKYVCGGRFLVHRYSVLRQHAAENGDLDEPLETNHTRNGKIEFHEDSDEDMLE